MGGRGRGRGRGGGGGSNKVGFVKPAEPSFIRKLKEQHGYKVVTYTNIRLELFSLSNSIGRIVYQ